MLGKLFYLCCIERRRLMHCSVDRTKYQIQIPLPPKIDASVTMMQVEEKPDVTYSDVGGCKEQIEKLREVVETPLLSVRRHILFAVTLTYPFFISPSDLLILALILQRVFYCLGRLVQVKHYVHVRLLIERMRLSFVLLVLSLCKSMLVRVPVWFENCLRWQGVRRLVSSSLMKSML